MNKSLTAVAFGALVALGTVAFSVSASAAIVCNDEGDCGTLRTSTHRRLSCGTFTR
jgi:hypothetical protein